MERETVPGMAEAIEARRIALHRSPGEMVRRSELTAPGLAPMRKGIRKQYRDSSRLGLAKALDWPYRALDFLLEGGDPAELETVDWSAWGTDNTPEEPIANSSARRLDEAEFFSRLARMPDHVLEEVERLIDAEERKERGG